MHMAPHKAQERAAVLKPAKCCCCLADEQLLQQLCCHPRSSLANTNHAMLGGGLSSMGCSDWLAAMTCTHGQHQCT